MARTGRLFRNGRSQAVRLPAEFRFEGAEVFIRKDPLTRDVILSRRPESWDSFFRLVDSTGVPADFMADRSDTAPQNRRLFDGIPPPPGHQYRQLHHQRQHSGRPSQVDESPHALAISAVTEGELHYGTARRP